MTYDTARCPEDVQQWLEICDGTECDGDYMTNAQIRRANPNLITCGDDIYFAKLGQEVEQKGHILNKRFDLKSTEIESERK